MADINLKTATPDTTLPTTGFLFGADSQAAASPSVYSTQTVATTLLGSTTLTGATVTTSQPVIDASQTWNDGGVTFTGLKFNATDTASASGSLLMDLQVGGSGKLQVRKDGRLRCSGIHSSESNFYIRVGNGTDGWGTGSVQFEANGSGQVIAHGGFVGLGSSADTILTRRAAANLRLGAADAAAPVAQTLSVQSVVAGTTNTAGANLTITGSQGTGTGAGGSIIFQVAPAGSSGTAQNALAHILSLKADNTVVMGRYSYNRFSFGSGGELNHMVLSGITQKLTSSSIIQPPANEISWNSGALPLNGGGTPDVRLFRDAANTLALRNGANAQAFRVYNTYTSATEFERGNIYWDSNVLKIGTEKGSAGGTARDLAFQTNGVTRFTITDSGGLVFPTNAILTWTGDGRFTFASSGVARISSSGADFNRLQFGGDTSSFPSLKRSSATLQVRLADDSGDADLSAKALTLSGNLTISTKDIVTDTTTGTKIGTGTTQKIGFYNNAPVVQPTAVADATDAATVITQLNALLSRMRDLGLIAT